jgi:small subunit ribosomal protein S16
VAVCIRLKRYGRTNRPFWRICATDRLTARDGRVIEELGHYDPLVADQSKVKIHRDRVTFWLKQGAQPSETVAQLLRHLGLDRKGNEVPPKPYAKRKPPKPAAARVAKAAEGQASS